jgi:hypothetical protein
MADLSDCCKVHMTTYSIDTAYKNPVQKAALRGLLTFGLWTERSKWKRTLSSQKTEERLRIVKTWLTDKFIKSLHRQQYLFTNGPYKCVTVFWLLNESVTTPWLIWCHTRIEEETLLRMWSKHLKGDGCDLFKSSVQAIVWSQWAIMGNPPDTESEPSGICDGQ